MALVELLPFLVEAEDVSLRLHPTGSHPSIRIFPFFFNFGANRKGPLVFFSFRKHNEHGRLRYCIRLPKSDHKVLWQRRIDASIFEQAIATLFHGRATDECPIVRKSSHGVNSGLKRCCRYLEQEKNFQWLLFVPYARRYGFIRPTTNDIETFGLDTTLKKIVIQDSQGNPVSSPTGFTPYVNNRIFVILKS